MVEGGEFTVGVYKTADSITVLPITEVITHIGQDFFDFEAKYGGKSTEVTPADITSDWQEQLEATARRIYQVFNCRGVVRIDFIYNANENKPYMLEINTIPGQSDASVIPQQVRAKGERLEDFYSKLLDEALSKH
jgi:D-alanine-D-alanine ligase